MGGLKRIDPLFTRTFEFDLPSLPEQQAIVAYLDEKAAAIDRKVALLEKKLAAFKRLKTSIINHAVTRGLDPNVKLKDSGVDWIGQVPEGWTLRRAKDLVVDRTGGDWGADETGMDGDCICLRVADFDFEKGAFKDRDRGEYTVRNYSAGKIGALKLRHGDICIEKSGGGDLRPVGRAVLFDLDVEAVYANFMDRLRIDENAMHSPYFLAVWRRMYSSRFTLGYLKQTTGIQNLQLTRLLNDVQFPVPTLREQREIIAYIEAECVKIDKAAAIAEKQIDAYRRLKRSLINEVVTGKRKVA